MCFSTLGVSKYIGDKNHHDAKLRFFFIIGDGCQLFFFNFVLKKMYGPTESTPCSGYLG